MVLPPGLTREDVTVTMNYYTPPRARFILKDRKGKKLAQVTGKLKNQAPWSESYPHYKAVVVNGTTEIIEHRKMEPIFYVNDDPAVRERVLSRTSKHGRK
jgi:hypothetical protein